jgi:hypothetical protein
MRDYKYQPTEWTLRKKRGVNRQLLLKLLVVLVVAGAGYGLFTWFNKASVEHPPEARADPRIIPLQLPPNPHAAARPAPPG